MSLVLIGYWEGEQEPGWPDPHDFVDPTWAEDERDIVTEFLRRGFIARAYMGYSRCRICGAQNGSLELTDGVHVWPEGLAHYLEEHDVRPPQSFVERVLAVLESYEESEIDEAWWREQHALE